MVLQGVFSVNVAVNVVKENFITLISINDYMYLQILKVSSRAF